MLWLVEASIKSISEKRPPEMTPKPKNLIKKSLCLSQDITPSFLPLCGENDKIRRSAYISVCDISPWQVSSGHKSRLQPGCSSQLSSLPAMCLGAGYPLYLNHGVLLWNVATSQIKAWCAHWVFLVLRSAAAFLASTNSLSSLWFKKS